MTARDSFNEVKLLGHPLRMGQAGRDLAYPAKAGGTFQSPLIILKTDLKMKSDVEKDLNEKCSQRVWKH